MKKGKLTFTKKKGKMTLTPKKKKGEITFTKKSKMRKRKMKGTSPSKYVSIDKKA